MLVDLGRNDVGRVASAGSVSVDALMDIERYSHVMHISSTVTGARNTLCLLYVHVNQKNYLLGRVIQQLVHFVGYSPGSVSVDALVDIERYSHGMYIASTVYIIL